MDRTYPDKYDVDDESFEKRNCKITLDFRLIVCYIRGNNEVRSVARKWAEESQLNLGLKQKLIRLMVAGFGMGF